MKKRITGLICLLAACFAVFCGCAGNGVKKYRAVIVENYVCAEGFPYGGDCLPDAGGDPVPSDQSFLFLNDGELRAAFEVFPEVDFENEMVAVYVWEAIYARNVFLSRVKVEEEYVYIDFKYQSAKAGIGDACAPTSRMLVVKMNKTEAIKTLEVLPTAEFCLLNPRG